MQPLPAKVGVSGLFSDHAVLLKDAVVPVWGTASAGEAVRVTLGTQSARTAADADGRWKVELDLSQSEAGPFVLEIAGENVLTFSDVLVGEVWLASGQSNMELTLSQSEGADDEIAASANDHLRVFVMEKTTPDAPETEARGRWVVLGPETAGAVSAVAYHFAKAIHRDSGGPVGILSASWGGTPVEAWTSIEALSAEPEFHVPAVRSQEDLRTYPGRLADFAKAFRAWREKYGREDVKSLSAKEAAGQVPTGGTWVGLTLPGASSDTLPASGSVWLRREVTIAPRDAGTPQQLFSGEIPGFYEVYWNGQRLAEVTPKKGGRTGGIYIPETKITAGQSVLAVRIDNPGGVPTILRGKPFLLGDTELAGEWRVSVEQALEAPTAEMLAEMPVLPRVPMTRQVAASFLFNGMIAPLIPYAIRGVIWYQGENNTGRAFQYRRAFPLLIRDWRTRWGRGDFGFYFCQLANFGKKSAAMEDPTWTGTWPELRESQTLALAEPHTGQVILLDLGEADDIHPMKKRDVGERLANLAKAKTYGRNVPFSGPVFREMKVEGGTLRLQFDHADGGLVAKPVPDDYVSRLRVKERIPLKRNSPDSELEGFAVCGEDRKWVWAQARIDGGDVLVWADAVPNPVAVRYAWQSNPQANLFNAVGLPAAPFRTDDFPLTTQNAKF